MALQIEQAELLNMHNGTRIRKVVDSRFGIELGGWQCP
jgi:hypothetical protein